MADEVKYEVVQHVCVLSESNGWRKEVNVVSWNGNKPKLDIREWNHEKNSMKKGITLGQNEFLEMVKGIKEVDAGSLANFIPKPNDSKSA